MQWKVLNSYPYSFYILNCGAFGAAIQNVPNLDSTEFRMYRIQMYQIQNVPNLDVPNLECTEFRMYRIQNYRILMYRIQDVPNLGCTELIFLQIGQVKVKNFFEKIFSELYTSKNPQKFTDFEGVVRFLIRHKIKIYSKKTEIFAYFTYGRVNISQPIKSILERLFDGFNDLYHKSVSQTLILTQKNKSFMQNR